LSTRLCQTQTPCRSSTSMWVRGRVNYSDNKADGRRGRGFHFISLHADSLKVHHVIHSCWNWSLWQ
jgi:hypothetical protein